MNKVFVLLFSLVSSVVTAKIEPKTSKTPALSERISPQVDNKIIYSNKDNTNYSMFFQTKELESKANYLKSTIYAKPSW